MKMLYAFLVVALAALAYGATLEEQWAEYKTKFEKNYEGDEEATRFALFSTRVADIEAHNAKFDKGEVSFSQGINQFTDLTEEELAKRTGGLRRGLKPRPAIAAGTSVP